MSSPTVATTSADGSANTVRPASRTYPNGRELSYDYGTAGGVNDLISRVAALDDDDTPLAEYQYLGLGAVVQQDSPEADLRFTLVNPSGTNDPDTGDIYSGLDRFGRVKDVRWRDVSADSDLSRVQYGYDRASNRTFRRNPSDMANQHDWLYGYDGLHRLQDASRGTLVFSGSQPSALSPQLFAQCWTLDPTGNWQGFRQADSGDPWDLVQARMANPVNEITGITNSTGPAWAQPAYDAAGNMTTIPQPADPTESYTATYDAWNRLVKLVDPATGHTVQENEYDGRGFRTVRKTYTSGALSETRQFYYTDGWRDVEERLGTSPDTADPDRQFVWGVRYIDDLVLRDRSDAGTLDERLYACQDGNWSVTAVVDDAGAVQERYEYDPYGRLTVLSPAFVVRACSSFGWETTYTGYRLDVASGLYAVRFRVLTPQLSWVLRDPLQDFNRPDRYAYASSAPTRWPDPFGLVEYTFPPHVGVPGEESFPNVSGFPFHLTPLTVPGRTRGGSSATYRCTERVDWMSIEYSAIDGPVATICPRRVCTLTFTVRTLAEMSISERYYNAQMQTIRGRQRVRETYGHEQLHVLNIVNDAGLAGWLALESLEGTYACDECGRIGRRAIARFGRMLQSFNEIDAAHVEFPFGWFLHPQGPFQDDRGGLPYEPIDGILPDPTPR